MQISKNKSATVVVLFLVFAMAVSLVALPAATAQGTKKTYAYIGATPNPIGVGQETLIHVGITDMLASAAYGWEGLTVTVTRPDGTTQTLGPYKTDSTGGTGDIYVPTMAGTYYLQTHFPEQVNPANSRVAPAGTVMLASSSEKLALNVTDEPRVYYSAHPLPSEYWTRPIDAQHREWAPISGNWLATPDHLFAPYNDGPETGHILWAKPLTYGGLVGGEFGDHAYHCGDAYEGKWVTRGTPVIMYGILYYNEYPSNYHTQLLRAVDIRTGEDLWSKEDARVGHGQVLYYSTMNQHGAFAFLWVTVGSTWHAYDALTGEWMYTMEGVPSGSNIYGPNGEILRYQLNLARGWMTMWNSTAIPALFGSANYADVYPWSQWRPWGKTVNATGSCAVTPETPLGIAGYMWNKTIPKGLPGSVQAVLEDRIIGASITSDLVVTWGLSLKPGQEGVLLFNETWRSPSGNLTIAWADESLEDGVFVITARELRTYYGFSIDTGKLLWGPTESEHYLNFFLHTTNVIAYGKLFTTGYGGIVYCYDVKTGNCLWTYAVDDPYTEILWSDNWPMYLGFVTDGKIYVYQTEHSVIDPKPRGAPFVCLDVETGEEVWRIDGAFRPSRWGGQPAIADSIIALYNTYDQRIYAIGKGPSATTVTASPEVSVHGSSVLVKGMVTDVSPGTKDAGLMMRFPNGVPAVSDECMSDWMKYVYLQFPRPADAVGVEVVISVVDPNNNSYEVGRATSDAGGMFKLMFTPEVPGEYTVIATFAGSESYWPSFAETAIGVEEAPQPTPAPTPVPQAPVEMYFTASTIAIIAAIAIGFALLLLKKR